MKEAVERAVAGAEAQTYVALSTGRTRDGVMAAEFEITWSFKRRA